MRLLDSVTIVHAADGSRTTVPAHVYHVSTADTAGDPVIGVTALVNVVRAIVRGVPEHFDPLADTILWRGSVFTLDGDAMPRVMHGRVHHYTLNLRKETTSA